MIEALYKPFQKWSEVGTVWIYSDPHFGDKELAAGIKDRPTAEEQVKMINAKVGRKDTLIILGDIINGKRSGRASEDEFVITSSHGIALSDVALGKMILERAEAQGVGTVLTLMEETDIIR